VAESEHRVRLFKIGESQTLRIPSGLELEGDDVILRKDGDRLIVEPVRKRGLFPSLRKLGALKEPALAGDDDSISPRRDPWAVFPRKRF